MIPEKMTIPGCPFPVYITEIDIGGRDSRRSREEAAVAALVRHVFGPAAVRSHTAAGAPFIPGRPEAISISHSKDKAAMAVAEEGFSVGIDIEDDRAQLPRVCRRILSDEEYAHFSEAESGFVQAWTLKEALYKASRSLFNHETDYASDLHILPQPEAAGRIFSSATFVIEGTHCAVVWSE